MIKYKISEKVKVRKAISNEKLPKIKTSVSQQPRNNVF